MANQRSRAALAAGVIAAGALAACGKLEAPSVVDSVRVLALQADPPYAMPGSDVALAALVVDGRADQTTPLVYGWAPAACIDPRGDAYYACFPGFADFTQSDLVPGSAWSFEMPGDVITRHTAAPAGDPSYGLAYVFLVACAGQLEVASTAGAAANALPLDCVDGQGDAVGSDDFVFAFAPIYAFTDRTNANPVIDEVDIDGAAVDPTAGVTLAACDQEKCPSHVLATAVPMSSWELDPADISADGTELHEAISADYYATGVSIDTPSVELYDPQLGASSAAIDHITTPSTPGDYALWVVVHDNRGGASWLEVPIHVQ